MKNTTIIKPLRFLEDHIDVILGLFFPAWFGIFFVLGLVLKLLPKEIAEKAGPQWMDTAFAILASLVVCAVIAILRMARNITGGTSRGPGPIIFLLATDILIMFFVFKMSAGMQAKMDTAYITSNLSLISKRLYAYQEEHGAYPPQQDLESLLETLGIQESDFYRTYYFDIHSAEYHASAGDSNDPEYRLVTLRAKDHLRFVRMDGSVGNEYLKDKNPPPVPKHEKERSAAIPEPLSHGSYPPQQDMESLLETLGLKDSDFQKVWLTDIKSAEYHAPPGAVKVPDVSQEPILTIRVRQHVFGGNQLYIVRRDGSGYTKY